MTREDLEQDLIQIARTIGMVERCAPHLLRAHADELVKAADRLNELAYKLSAKEAAE